MVKMLKCIQQRASPTKTCHIYTDEAQENDMVSNNSRRVKRLHNNPRSLYGDRDTTKEASQMTKKEIFLPTFKLTVLNAKGRVWATNANPVETTTSGLLPTCNLSGKRDE
jgi:hypothetical protein